MNDAARSPENDTPTDAGASGQWEDDARSLPSWFYLAIPAVLLLAFLLYMENLGFALVGHDTYPIIVTAKTSNLSDFLGVFTEELMDGRFPGGHYFRPVLNLSFALDHTLWGIRPWGYHLTDLVLFGICVCLLMIFLRSLIGSRSVAAVLFSGLFFLTHPVHLSTLAVPARRGDTLCLVFVLLALFFSCRKGRSRLWAPTLCALLAVGAKETGVLAVPLIFVLHLLLPRRGDASRILKAVKASLLPGGFLLLYLLARQQVLTGAAGTAGLDIAAFWDHALLILPGFQSSTCYPVNVLEELIPASTMRLLIPCLIALSTVLFLRKPPLLGCALFFWTWLVLAWAIHGLAQNVRPDIPWYALHTTAPFTLLVALLLQESILVLSGRRCGNTLKASAALCSILIVFLLAVNVSAAPPFTYHPEWHTTTSKINIFLEKLEKKMTAAADGKMVVAPPLPFKYPHDFEPGQESPPPWIPCLADYTVKAWAELVFPERNIRVIYFKPGLPLRRQANPSPEEVVVVLVPR